MESRSSLGQHQIFNRKSHTVCQPRQFPAPPTWEHVLLDGDGVTFVAGVHPQVLPAQLVADEGWATLSPDCRVC